MIYRLIVSILSLALGAGYLINGFRVYKNMVQSDKRSGKVSDKEGTKRRVSGKSLSGTSFSEINHHLLDFLDGHNLLGWFALTMCVLVDTFVHWLPQQCRGNGDLNRGRSRSGPDSRSNFENGRCQAKALEICHVGHETVTQLW
jgi:hypothetical protein